LLTEHENTWRLKNIAVWFEKGDENTKFFQSYAKGRNAENIIWSLKDQEGRPYTSFNKLANLGKNHFHTLFKVDRNTNIIEIIKVAFIPPKLCK